MPVPTHMRPNGGEGWIVYDISRIRRAIADGERYWIKAFGRWYPYGRTAYLDARWHPGAERPNLEPDQPTEPCS